MSRRDEASKDEISTHPIGKLLAIPVKGRSDRKLAIATWCALAGATFTCLTMSIGLQDREPASKPKEKPHGTEVNDAFKAAPEAGYYPTYLDGGGGIAGVPLTEEQRKAVIREAQRRGLSVEDAYALAYGDGAVIHVHRDGTVHVHTEKVVVPDGPVYAKAGRAESGSVAASSGGAAQGMKPEGAAPGPEDAKDEPAGTGKLKSGKVKDEKAAKEKKAGKGAQDPSGGASPAGEGYYPTTGKSLYEEDEGAGLKTVLPPALEKVVDGADVFTEWLRAASPGEAVVIGPVQSASRMSLKIEAPMMADLTVTTTIEAPLSAEAAVQPVVSTVVTDTETGEVLAEQRPERCPNADAVSSLAIEQVVDAVTEARE
ncbi:hypothetical protein J7E99_28575 [Streptomyces sp. ISL-44]|uniref:hypothetical protein n=1 Tax=Streptomyces sp. ISL-44 TaxID=2819184 RepID=UPI001BEC7520|nr:hypothetical protein [Streptomyces sp. ISL-44]MBT2544549.1 hypothetical protein [Streptomyces sp. ISL-44]